MMEKVYILVHKISEKVEKSLMMPGSLYSTWYDDQENPDAL